MNIYNEENGIPLNEAFAHLITQRVFYKNTGISKKMAHKDKVSFLNNPESVPEFRKRKYLEGAGYVKTQEEKWELKK